MLFTKAGSRPTLSAGQLQGWPLSPCLLKMLIEKKVIINKLGGEKKYQSILKKVKTRA